jgi:hypothetical protein
MTAFNQFVDTVKVAFTQSVDHVYIVSTILMAAALIAVSFIPQVELRNRSRPVLEEIGVELEEELAQGDKKFQEAV